MAIIYEVIDRIHAIAQNYSTKERNYNETEEEDDDVNYAPSNEEATSTVYLIIRTINKPIDGEGDHTIDDGSTDPHLATALIDNDKSTGYHDTTEKNYPSDNT